MCDIDGPIAFELQALPRPSVIPLLARRPTCFSEELTHFPAPLALVRPQPRVAATAKGIPITLSVLFIAVARRLGLTLLPINCPRQFILSGNIDGSEYVSPSPPAIFLFRGVGSLF